MAIVLDLVTKPDTAALRSSSSLIEKHFAVSGLKAGEDFSKALATGIEKSPAVAKQVDKLADLTGRLRIEQEKLNAVNAKGNVTEAQKIAQAERVEKVQRDIIRSTRETAAAYELANTKAGGFITTLANLSAGTRFGGVIASADNLAGKFGGVGLAAGGAIAGVAALGVAAVAVGKNLYDLGATWDSISDSITAKSGKVGAELAAITDQVARVSTTTAATQQELGNIAGSAVSSLRLSGTALGDMVKQIADLNKLTGQETNIRGLGLAFRMFKVDGEQQIPFLNELYATFQKTGIPVNDLIETLDKGGAVLSGFGMSATTAAATIALFEEAGVPADQALKGLTYAFKQLNKAGEDPVQGLRDMVTQIRQLHDAGNDLGTGGARDLAEKYFGRGFAPILQSITEGRFELDKLPTSVGNVGNKIDEATKSTEDFTEHWQKFKNQMSVELKPVADLFFSFMNAQMDSVLDTTKKFTSAWEEWGRGDWFNNTVFGHIAQALGLIDKPELTGGGGTFGNTVATGPVGGLNLDTIPTTVQKYANDCIDASAAIILSHSGVNMTEDQLKNVITPGGSISSLAAGLNKLAPQGNFQALEGSGGSQQAMFDAIKGSIDKGVGSILNVAPGSSIAGKTFSDGHFIAVTGYNPDGTINLSDTANGKQYTVSAADAFQATRGRGIVAGTGRGPAATVSGGIGNFVGQGLLPKPSTATTPGSAGSAGAPAASGPPPNFPSADQVGPASGITTPVQMVPSPYGPQYAPVPAGSTAGFDRFGKPGTYLPDPQRIDSATKRYQNSLDNINDANAAIADALERQSEIEQDRTADSRKRADAAKAVTDAEKRRDDLIDQAKAAQDELAQAKLGTFQQAQKQMQASTSGAGGGLNPLANDFGLGEGLPGFAKFITTFLGNLAMAPLVGQLQAISSANPIKGGSGLLGIMGAQNIAAGRSPLGLGFGADLMPETQQQSYANGGSVFGEGTSTSDSIPAMLSSGEHVLTAADVSKMGGHAGVYAFRAALQRGLVPGFDSGGASTGQTLDDYLSTFIKFPMPQGAGITYNQSTLNDLGFPSLFTNPKGGTYNNFAQIPDWIQGFVKTIAPGLSASSSPHGSLHGKPGGAANAVDVTGSEEEMRQFAEFLAAHPELSAQVIHGDAATGKTYGVAGGQNVPAGSYYTTAGGSYADEQNMVHWSPAILPRSMIGNLSPAMQRRLLLKAFSARGYAAGGPVDDTGTKTLPQAANASGGFSGVGGLPLQAIMSSVAGLDLIAPGASEAAQIGIQLANRAVAYGGQLAGIGVSGLMETFLPHGSAVGDPGKSWLGKLAAGFSGARPSVPNAAGQLKDPSLGKPDPTATPATPGIGAPAPAPAPAAAPDAAAKAGESAPPQTPEQAAALQQSGNMTTQPNAPMVKIDQIVNNTPDSGRSLAQQISYHQMIANGRGVGPVAALAGV